MKGDKKIVDILNNLLAGELTAVDQYLIHGEMYADMGFARLAEKALHAAELPAGPYGAGWGLIYSSRSYLENLTCHWREARGVLVLCDEATVDHINH